jgi:hypothetical protein
MPTFDVGFRNSVRIQPSTYWSFSGIFPKGFAIKILCAKLTNVPRARSCYVIRNWMVLIYLQCLTWSSVVPLHVHYVPWCSELSAVRCQLRATTLVTGITCWLPSIELRIHTARKETESVDPHKLKQNCTMKNFVTYATVCAKDHVQ